MFKKFYAERKVENPAYVVRDSRTRQIIASGDLEKCNAYQSAFGLCYVEAA